MKKIAILCLLNLGIASAQFVSLGLSYQNNPAAVGVFEDHVTPFVGVYLSPFVQFRGGMAMWSTGQGDSTTKQRSIHTALLGFVSPEFPLEIVGSMDWVNLSRSDERGDESWKEYFLGAGLKWRVEPRVQLELQVGQAWLGAKKIQEKEISQSSLAFRLGAWMDLF